MVKSLHKRDLRFDLGLTLQILTQQGVGATVLTQLVDIGALPAWGDDIRALKDKGIGEVTILELAKLRFQENKELLSGGEYGSLKTFGISDAGILAFAQKGGTQQQLQKLREELALGKPEQEALKTIGM
jgi:maltooligosyltrehalose synthase